MTTKTTTTVQNEPRRHHYIPQFLLRNFCNEKGQLLYWNIKTNKLESRNSRSVFMNIDMYRDEENHDDDPTFIESNLGKFEHEIAELISNKILNRSEIVLTRAELDSLRIFLSLLSYRSDSRMNQYKDKKFFNNDEELLKKYTKDGDFEDLWKREVEALSSCRSYEEIENNETITPTIKQDFLNDSKLMFMTIVDARGGDFLLSDIYPTLEVLPYLPTVNLHMHMLYPISPTRMILLNNIAFKYPPTTIETEAMYRFSKIKGDMIKQPKNKYMTPGLYTKEDLFIYKPQKIYEDDVAYINALILNEARIGLVFNNCERISHSVRKFNERNDTKQKYEDLEKSL